MDHVHIAFCCDRAYIQPMEVAMRSVLDTARQPERLVFWVITKTITMADAEAAAAQAKAVGARFELRSTTPVEARLLDAPVRGHLSSAAYYRLFLPELLPGEVERVIYLDCDVVVCRPIEELWATDLEGHPIAAVMKPRAEEFADVGLAAETDYFNSGVLVINVRRWRQLDVPKNAMRFAATHPGRRHGHDQPALNHLFNGDWKHLDLRWNQQFKFYLHTVSHLRMSRQLVRKVRRDPFIIHYTTASKPWHYINTHPWRWRYYDVLDRTRFAGWRPQPASRYEPMQRMVAKSWPCALRPQVLRNVYRPRYHALKARLRTWLHFSKQAESPARG